LATELLDHVGVTVTVANNGREALERLTMGPPFDAVLMDVQMPEMDGYEAARRIRASPELAGLHVIAMTATATQEERQRCMAAGMNDFLTKPIDPELLYIELAKWVPERPVGSTTAGSLKQAPGIAAVASTKGRVAIDLTVLGHMVANDVGQIRKFAFMFIETARNILAEMDAARNRRDLAMLGGLGHKLKSSASIVGALGLADLCQALETAGKADDWQQAEQMLVQLPPLLEAITRQVEDELG
jgi:two-component system, sensor histidine kinase and response regulator